MAQSKVSYTGDGNTVLFSFSFPYLEEDHVVITIDGAPTSDYTFANASTIQFNSAPADQSAIVISRITPADDPVSTFNIDSAFAADDLNRNYKQSIYIAQEVRDASGEALLGQIPDNSIGATKYADGSITDAKIGDNVLTPYVSSINDGPLAGFRNLLINSSFLVNQRIYTSGAATTAPNQYTLDRWRVVVSGQNVSWTGDPPARTATCPAGGLEQIVSSEIIVGGTYTLNWEGTATATVNGAAVAKGGQVVLSAGVNATVRFSNGTLSKPQLEPGAVATPWETRTPPIELLLCSPFCCIVAATMRFRSATATETSEYHINWRTPMRAQPVVSFKFTGARQNVNQVNVGDANDLGVRYQILALNANLDTYSLNDYILAEAELA